MTFMVVTKYQRKRTYFGFFIEIVIIIKNKNVKICEEDLVKKDKKAIFIKKDSKSLYNKELTRQIKKLIALNL